MSKTCFLTIRNIFNTSSLPKYAEILDYRFDIIYWDQHGIEEECGAENHYKFHYPIKYGGGSRRKILGYLKFKSFAEKIIRKNEYDKIIVLPTQTAILFYFTLTKKYKNRYLIDIRDYTKEHNVLFYKVMERLITSSGLSVITSPAYKEFLPEYDYVLSHNITKIDKSIIKEYRNRTRGNQQKIIISCIGSIRFIDQFKKVIDNFANDSRFQLHFIGRGSERLKEYCELNCIDNVKLVGRFNNKETLKYYMNTDIIMNLYGNNSPFLDYALSNKLYYGATLGIPILVSPGTYMDKITSSNGFGFTYDLNRDMRDELYNFYMNMNWKAFYFKCDSFIRKVLMNEKVFRSEVKYFLEEK